MFVFKHACLNLRSHRWSFLLVGMLLFLLISSTMLTNIIYTSVNEFTKNYDEQFKTLVTIGGPELNNSVHEKKLTKEQYFEFGKSKYVRNMKMLSNISVSFEALQIIENQAPVQVQRIKGDMLEKYSYQEIMNWFGADSSDLEKELAENKLKLTEGSIKLKHNECLISNELAQLNHLSIGDSIRVVSGEEKKELRIAGMYQQKDYRADQLFRVQKNDILTNLETLHSMKSFAQSGFSDVTYELKNKTDFPKFLKEMQEKGLPDDYQVMTNETTLEMVLHPVKGVKTLAGTILLGSLIFGNFSLVIFSIWGFKYRQTEICVSRNIGLTKKQLIKSCVIETLIMAVISFSVALPVAIGSVQSIANWQLDNQKQLAGSVEQLFSLVSNGTEASITSIPMIINWNAFISILGITSIFLLTIIVINSYKIFKFKSIEYLLERKLNEQ